MNTTKCCKIAVIIFINCLNSIYAIAQVKNNKQLSFDGLYNTYDTSRMNCGDKTSEHYTTYHFLIFLKGETIFYTNILGTLDNAPFKREFYKRFKPDELGSYKIVGDSLYATIPSYFALSGMRLRLFDAHYAGYIKNSDTIVGWKMIPPYPKVKPRLNDYFKTDTAPKMLYFIKNDAVNALEEIADKK